MDNTQKTGIAAASFAAVLTLAIPFVAPLEGRTLSAYLDVNGVPTICNGITQDVKIGQTRTDKQCDELLKNELGKAISFVDKKTTKPLSVYQRAALASFTFNVGTGNFSKSTLLKRINNGELPAACDEFLKWVYVGGKDCRLRESNCSGIVRRRKSERELCLKP